MYALAIAEMTLKFTEGHQ